MTILYYVCVLHAYTVLFMGGAWLCCVLYGWCMTILCLYSLANYNYLTSSVRPSGFVTDCWYFYLYCVVYRWCMTILCYVWVLYDYTVLCIGAVWLYCVMHGWCMTILWYVWVVHDYTVLRIGAVWLYCVIYGWCMTILCYVWVVCDYCVLYEWSACQHQNLKGDSVSKKFKYSKFSHVLSWIICKCTVILITVV